MVKYYPTILYLNGKYCKTTDDIHECLSKASSVDTSEGKEILEAYANGTLKEWLEQHEGKDAVEQLQEIENDCHNSDTALMNDLQKVFGIRNKKTLKPKFADFISVRDSKSRSYYGKSSIKESRVIKLNSQRNNRFSLSFVFNMEKSIHEKYELFLKKSYDGNGMWHTLSKKTIDTGNWAKGEDITVLFADLQCNLFEENKSKISLFVDNTDEIWSGSVVVGKDVTLIVDGNIQFNMLYVPGDTSVRSFYLGETVVTNSVAGSLQNRDFGDANKPYVKRANYYSFRDLILNPLLYKFGINFRLPTKEEWNYAATGGNNSDQVRFAGDAPVERLAWFACDTIHEVKLKEPNAFGFYDMNGNVWEMVGDEYSQDFCGGAYDSSIEELELSFSMSDIVKSNSDSNTGFRLVCSVEDVENLLSTQRGVLIEEVSFSGSDTENDGVEDEILRKKEKIDLLEIE